MPRGALGVLGCTSWGSQDFERVGAPRGGCRISGLGDDGGAVASEDVC